VDRRGVRQESGTVAVDLSRFAGVRGPTIAKARHVHPVVSGLALFAAAVAVALAIRTALQ